MKELKKYLAEFIGTCVLVTFGCGTACAVGCDTPAGYFATAVAFGLAIVAMAYSIGNVSGCHVNPAVSLAMLISKKMSGKDFCGYVIAQFLGALAGAGLLVYLFGKDSGLGTNSLLGGIDSTKGFVVECVLTFVFLLAILGVTKKAMNAQVAGLVIGLTLTFVHILGIYFTGTSVNPARSFGPAIIYGGDPLNQLWIFITAPLVGATAAALVYKFIDDEK